jgi:hypothetical protein
MTVKPEKADDDVDAFDALESEEKEFIKVSIVHCLNCNLVSAKITSYS